MKVLLTGANGQIGFCLARLLEKKEWDFLALDKSQLDITDAFAVEDVVLSFKPDIVINAAAYTAVDKAESDSENAFKINLDGAKNLAKSTNNIGAAIFHISTDYVFSGNSDYSYSELDPVAPQSVYGSSKLKGEQAVASENPKHIILRTAWVFGEHGNNFVKTMVRLGQNRDKLTIVSDQWGGPTYAGDVAEVLLKIASQYLIDRNLSWGIYHYAGFPYANWYEFAVEIFKEVDGQKCYSGRIPEIYPISTKQYPTPARRPASSRLNCKKIEEIFDVKCSDWISALKNIKAYL